MSSMRHSEVVDRVALIRNLLVHGREHVEGQADDAKSQKELDRLVRLLRPQTAQTADHTHAVRTRIRRTILNSPAAGSEGPDLLSRFDKTFEVLTKLNPALANPIIIFLKPLSFSTKFTPTFKNAMDVDRHLGDSVAKLDVGSKSTFTHPEMISTLTSNVVQGVGHSLLASQENIPLFSSNSSGDMTISAELWLNPAIENKLIQDILYILQGVNGRHIKYDSRSELFVIDPSLHVVSTARDLILSTCELGWVYNKVTLYIKTILNTTSTHGLVPQALAAALQEEIAEYYRLLVVIENEAKYNNHMLTTSVQSAGPSPFESGRGGKEEKSEVMVEVGLTLYRLRAWLAEPMDKMILLARLVDSLGPLTGGAIISRLYSHTRHGDPTYQTLLTTLLNKVTQPYNNMIIAWVLHGEIHDTHTEFFVQPTKTPQNKGQNKGNPWHDNYSLISALIPSFLSVSLAQKMLNIGRSINYLKLCLHRPALVDHNKNRNLGGVGRRSFRQINKQKKLTLYGRVVDEKVDFMEAVDEEEENEKDEKMAGKIEAKMGGNVKDKSTKTEGKPEGKTKDKDQILKELFQPIFNNNNNNHDGENHPNVILDQALSALRSTHLINSNNFDTEEKGDKNNLEVVQYTGKIMKNQEHQQGEFLLTSLIHRLSRAIDTQLLHLLEHRFAINDHLYALKRFMLLGQGDFVLCLMDSIGPELKKRAGQLFRHNLTAILEGALRQSNAQYDPQYILDRVSIRLLEATPGDSGWEIFSLDYNVSDVPLNAIIHTVAMQQYRMIFHMLWRLKRVEWSLTTTWKQFLHFKNTTSDRSGGNSHTVLKVLKLVFQRCHLYRAQMMHFVTNLCAFLMFEVLETAWIALQEKLTKATSLDDIILAHDAYLHEIMLRALLTEESEKLNMAIQQLLQTILRFCSLEETLVADAMATSARQKLIMDGGYDEEDDRRGDGDVVPAALVMRIEETAKDYTVQLTQLMTMLKEEGEQSSETLRYLIFRLDFNGFFETSSSASIGKSGSLSPLSASTVGGNARKSGGGLF